MKKLLIKNTLFSLIYQLVTIISAFVLPKMILIYYGSEVNGLINSITQFLSIIAFLELGLGAVVQSALYKPLLKKDSIEQSKIYVSSQNFFSKLAFVLLVYVVILIFIYPTFINSKYDFIYTGSLIVSMSISSFAQYYFGITNTLLLNADQKNYVQYYIQIITLICSTIVCVLLIIFGFSIQIVKLISAIFYLLRPLLLNYYVNKNYSINKKIKYDKEPIKQKWDGISQHIAAIVLDGTDTIVLSVFSTLNNVSIYSVYYLVISGVKQLFNSITSGLQSTLGTIYASGDNKKLTDTFFKTEWIIHNLTIFIMGCVLTMITPFVIIYTLGIKDANYNQSFFGYILTFAYLFYCLRLPYHMLIKAGGFYKETKNKYVISAILNLLISIIMVKKYGLIGVAIGTFIAMFYQVIELGIYSYKKVIKCNLLKFFKQLSVDLLIIVFGIIISKIFIFNDNSISSFILSSIKSLFIWSFIAFIFNFIFYRKDILKLFFLKK